MGGLTDLTIPQPNIQSLLSLRDLSSFYLQIIQASLRFESKKPLPIGQRLCFL